MTVAHPFDSPRLTLERAKHHVRDLSKVVGAFTDGQPRPWSYVLDTESQAPNKVYKVRFHTPPPAEAACIIFDAVNNLRATLDQIGYSAAIASGKTDPSGTNFPFGDDAAGVENVFKRNRAHLTLPPQIMDLFPQRPALQGRKWSASVGGQQALQHQEAQQARPYDDHRGVGVHGRRRRHANRNPR